MKHASAQQATRRWRFFLIALATLLLLLSSTSEALDIVPTYTSNVTSQSNAAQIEAAFQYAAQQFEYRYPAAITINITVDTQPLGSGFLGKSNAPNAGFFTYATVRGFLTASATSSDQLTNLANNWPATDPTGSNSQWVMAYAEAKALGLRSANDPAVDGTFTFDNSTAFTFDPYNRASTVANTYDFIGTAEHEISEIMGRTATLGTVQNGKPTYEPYDLSRYSAAGVRSFNGVGLSVYFSIDGGTTNLKQFNSMPPGDGADWQNYDSTTFKYIPDSFNAFSNPKIANTITPVGATAMDILGYNAGSPNLTWNGGSQDFLTGNNWSAIIQPTINPYHGVNLLVNSAGANAFHSFTAGENFMLASVSDMGQTLEVRAGTLSIGRSGISSGGGFGILVNQDGLLQVDGSGTLNVLGQLSVGDAAGVTNGYADLYGNGAVHMGNQIGIPNGIVVGYSGTGEVNQRQSAVVTASGLTVGNNAGSSGIYDLNNTASLTVSGNETIGNSGSGSFVQYNGTNNVSGILKLGVAGQSAATYYLDAGTLITGSVQINGGTFTQSGGTSTINNSDALVIGNLAAASGSYIQYAGSLTANGHEFIGDLGVGTFTQTAGTNTIAGGGLLILGATAGGNGSYNLSGTGALSAGNGEYIGDYGVGTFTQSGGTNTITSASGLYVGYVAGSTGTYALQSGTLSVTAGPEHIGESGSGTFNQTGGTNSITSGLRLEIGYSAGSNGVYNLSGAGSISTNGPIVVADNGTGTFNQMGGTITINSSDALALGLAAQSNGSYVQSGGTLTAGGHEFIGDLGTGTFTQTGGTNTIASGSFLIVGAVSGSSGTYHLDTGGTLNANGEEYIGDSGTGAFNQTGGTHNVNLGHNVNIGFVSGASGTYTLSDGSAVVSGSVYLGGSSSGPGGAGVLSVSGTGHLQIAGSLVIYDAAGNGANISGGTIDAAALNFNGNPARFNWTAGTLNLTSSVTWDSAAAPSSTSNAFGPSLSLGAGQTLQVSGNETLGGAGAFSLTVGPGAAHSATGNLTIGPTGSLTAGGGAVSATSVINSGLLTINGGFPMTGDFTQKSAAVVSFGLSGTTRGTQYGAIVAAGNVALDGTLEVSLDSYTPAPRDKFDLFDWSSPLGAFASVQLPPLSGSLVWNTSQLYSTGVISVVDSNFLLGDINRDGHVNVADVEALADALADLTAYQATHGPGGSALTDSQLLQIADLDGDNLVTNSDVQGLIVYLANNAGALPATGGGSPTAVPEPATLILSALGVGGAAVLIRRELPATCQA